MTNTELCAQPLYSTLQDDPDLGEIVLMFIEEMQGRIDDLQTRLASGNWEDLARAAHQLKGAAGSYGFAPITDVAARVEYAVRSGRPEAEILGSARELIEICRRAQVRVA